MLLMKSKIGQAAFKERSALFSSRQRAAFILFDGRSTVAEILTAMAPIGVNHVDVDALRNHGFLEPVRGPVLQAFAASPTEGLEVDGIPVPTAQERFIDTKTLSSTARAKTTRGNSR